MGWMHAGVVAESLRVMAFGLAGILGSTVIFILLTVALRRAFPAPGPQRPKRPKAKEAP